MNNSKYIWPIEPKYKTTKRKVLKEQLEYEKREHDRLVNARIINIYGQLNLNIK